MLADDIRSAAKRFGAAAVLDDSEGSLSYADLDARSERIATGLWRRGLRPGDRIVLRLPNGGAYLLAYAAAAKLGAVVAGINPGLAEFEQQRLVLLADPAAVIDTAETLAALENCGSSMQLPELVPDPARLVALVFTSGTTGTPRAAMFTERQLREVTAIEAGRTWATRPGQPVLVATHFAHVGPTTKLRSYLRRGLRLQMLPRWQAGEVLRVAARQRLTEIGAIPPQVALMLKTPEIADLDLSCLRRIIAGGAASSPALIRQTRQALGCEYVVRYSSTESGGVGLGTAADDPEEALRGIGRPRPGVEAQIRDDIANALPPGQTGELYLRTPTAMTGYWRDDEATADALAGGWLRTGDLAVKNPGGSYTLKGRLKEMYIRGGYNIYPAEVEAQLCEHPAIAACAVVPRPDETMGEIGVAVVALKQPSATLTLDNVRAFLDRRLARWKQPEQLVVVEELPLNGTHKTDRRALTAMLARQSAPGD